MNIAAMTTFLITEDMLKNIECDRTPYGQNAIRNQQVQQQQQSVISSKPTTTVLVIFENSDQNAAIYYINKSIEDPLKNGVITTILIEELAKQDFHGKFLQSLQNLNTEHKVIKTSSEFETIPQLNVSVLATISTLSGTTTKIVRELYNKSLKTLGDRIITLHTFRNTKECLALIKADTEHFDNASIWLDNHSYAYHLIASLNCETYFLNCYQICLKQLKQQSTPFALIHEGYHFETIYINNMKKNIVFPVNIPKKIAS